MINIVLNALRTIISKKLFKRSAQVQTRWIFVVVTRWVLPNKNPSAAKHWMLFSNTLIWATQHPSLANSSSRLLFFEESYRRVTMCPFYKNVLRFNPPSNTHQKKSPTNWTHRHNKFLLAGPCPITTTIGVNRVSFFLLRNRLPTFGDVQSSWETA